VRAAAAIGRSGPILVLDRGTAVSRHAKVELEVRVSYLGEGRMESACDGSRPPIELPDRLRDDDWDRSRPDATAGGRPLPLPDDAL
jgi:hypothetical protein